MESGIFGKWLAERGCRFVTCEDTSGAQGQASCISRLTPKPKSNTAIRTFIMLSSLSPEAVRSAKLLENASVGFP